MSYQIVVIIAGVASAGLLPTTLWPGTLAEMMVVPVSLGILLNVVLTYNSPSITLTDSPTQNRRLEDEEGTDYHGQRLYWNPIGAVQALVDLLTTMMYSKT